MALNFPPGTPGAIYLDPATGLKYVFNGSVGAWESAIQPPAIIADYPPNIDIPGFLYWDRQDGTLYVYYTDENSSQWVEAVPSPPGSSNSISVGEFPPGTAIPGDLWFNSINGRLYFYYDDGGSGQWVDVTGSPGGGSGGGGVVIDLIPPSNPADGSLWFNITDGRLYTYYNDGDSTQWVDVTGANNPPDGGITNLTGIDRSILVSDNPVSTDIRVNMTNLPTLP